MRFNEREFALRYNSRMIQEGYPGNLLMIVESELEFPSTLIDVGAGSGFFSIPLAERGMTIFAVEPSTEMISLLKQKVSPELSEYIIIRQMSWETWTGEKTNYLLCAHSLYPMKDWDKAIVKMKKSAGKILLFVRADSGSRTLSDGIRSWLGMSRSQAGASSRVKEILTAREIVFTAREIRQERIIRFSDLDAEAGYHIEHLGIESVKKEEIIQFLSENCIYSDGMYSYSSIYVDNLFLF